MERLTRKAEIDNCPGIWVQEGFANEGLQTWFNGYDEGYSAINKCAEYEDAEEKGLLKILPCGIGDDIYFIPSKVNFGLNILSHHEEYNQVYHQKVELIIFTKDGWYIECDKDREYGTGIVHVDSYFKETWFLTKEEAEQALKKMESEECHGCMDGGNKR